MFGPQSSAPTDCTSGGTTVGTATVSGDGTYNPSSGFTPSDAGDYWWYASYNGDSDNTPAASTCGPSMAETVVAKASTSFTSGASPTATTYGNSVMLSATGLPSGATGTVIFTSGGNTLCSGTVSTGSASCSTGTLAPATYPVTATYSGDTNYQGSTSTTSFTISKVTPSLTATAPANATVGSAISPSSVSATLASGASPSGTVTFEVFGPQSSAPTDCTSGGTTVGTATVSGDGTYNPSSGFTPSDAGDYWWYASYNGDSDNTPAASTCGPSMAETVVAKASTSFTSGASPTATTYGNSVMLSATGLPSGATGTVIFTSGGNALCSGTVSTGSASCSTGTLAPATYPVTATYSGDTNYQGSTSTTSFTISKVTPSLTATAPANATVGSAISPSSVSGTLSSGSSASGTVTFEVFGPQSSAPTDCTSGGTTVGTATVSGDGTYNPSSGFTPSDAGDYWWYASYNGDSDNTPAASTCGASMAETLVAPSPIPTPPTVSNVSISTSGSSSQSGPVVDPGIEVTCPGGGSSCSASEQATVMIGAANTPVESGPRVEHPMTLSSTQSTILAGGSSNAAFHLNQLGMRLLSDHKRLSVQITVSGYAHGATPVTATKTITLDGRFASYKVSAVKVYRDGTITLRVNLSTPGHVNVLVSAWNDNIAGEARVLNPSPGRFVVGRASTNTKKAGVLTLRVRPTAQGKRLIAHPAYPVTLRLWVSYIPLYAFQINRGDYGLHP